MPGLELILIRHPRPAGGEGLCYGRLDLPLAEPANATLATAVSRLQPLLAACLDAAAPPANSASGIASLPCFTSPRQRCQQLAAALHPAPVIDARLAEMDFGQWEGRPWEEVPRAELDAWAAAPSDYAPPGGEAPATVLHRLLAWADSVQHQGIEHALVVSHAGPIRLLLCHALGLQLAAWERLPLAYASLTRLRLPASGAAGAGQVLAANL